MKTQSFTRHLISQITCAALLSACALVQLTSKAMPHWDVSNPGGNGAVIFGPMTAKSGVLYLGYLIPWGATHLAKWVSGTGYSDLGQLGSPTDSSIFVNAMCIQGDYLYVVGYFTMTCQGGIVATNIARYGILSGVWAPVGDNSLADGISAVAVDSNGKIYVAADGTDDRGAAVHSLLKYWNGSSWATVGSGMYGSATERYGIGRVTALAADGTDIYAAGTFDAGVSGSTIVYSTNIIKWDGATWHAMGTPAGNGLVIDLRNLGEVYKIAVTGSNVFVAGLFQGQDDTTVPPIGLDRFSTNCSHVQAYSLTGSDGSPARANDVSARNGYVYVAGDFDYIDSTPMTGVGRWNGSTWSMIGQVSGVNGPCTVAQPDQGGASLYVHGSFDHADGATLPFGPPIRWTSN